MLMLAGGVLAAAVLLRERGHFWQSRPSLWLVASSIADLAVVAFMATRGVLMIPVSPTLVGELLVVVAAYLLF